MRKAVYLFLLLWCCTPIHAQILPFQHYAIKNGLPSAWITFIFQDSRGYLWISGDEGVSVYDGIRFKNYGVSDGLPVSQVWRVYESPSSPGTMWIGTHGAGVVKFARTAWPFSRPAMTKAGRLSSFKPKTA